MFPYRDFLTDVNFFKGRVTCEFLKHEVLFREKDRADQAYFICKGMIAIIKRNSVGKLFQIYTVSSGRLIGIQDLYGGGRYNVTAVALESVIAYKFSKREVERNFRENAFLKLNFAQRLSHQLLHLENQLLKD